MHSISNSLLKQHKTSLIMLTNVMLSIIIFIVILYKWYDIYSIQLPYVLKKNHYFFANITNL